MPKISVLMSVYNNASTVEASIASIQAQTLTDYEFIICDDGSSDGTPDILRRAMESDSRIIFIQNDENRGTSFALNRCLGLARGEYCARMDGDDICDSDRFEKQAYFLDTNPGFGFVSSTMKRFDEEGVYWIPDGAQSYAPEKKDFIKGSPFCHAPAMLRRSAYEAVGGYRDTDSVRGVEDYDLWFRLYAAGIRGYVLAEPLYSMFDGRDAARRRTFKRRLNEAHVRAQGYRMLNIPLLYRVYALKPLVLAFIPNWLYKILR